MKTYLQTALVLLAIVALPAMAKKPCEELKKEIAAKLDSKGVKNYSLEIVPADTIKGHKVIGTCDANTKRIVYRLN